MSRPVPDLVIDARPRGPSGPLAGESFLGEPILLQLMRMAEELGARRVLIHVRDDDQVPLRSLASQRDGLPQEFRFGSPVEGSFVLRADRIYDLRRLKHIAKRGGDPDKAVIWRLDSSLALAGARDEFARRTSYQPLGRYWAIGPARWLARLSQPTFLRPNMITLAAGALVFTAAVVIAFAPGSLAMRLATAAALAVALVLDTADGHLARLQGTASRFGRWLDATLDEAGDMALHAAIAWSCFVRDQQPLWLVAGMAYGMGKYVFFTANTIWDESREDGPKASVGSVSVPTGLRSLAHWAGHADVRWHLWIVLAVCGRLDLELIAFAVYFPLRALGGGIRKAVGRA